MLVWGWDVDMWLKMKKCLKCLSVSTCMHVSFIMWHYHSFSVYKTVIIIINFCLNMQSLAEERVMILTKLMIMRVMAKVYTTFGCPSLGPHWDPGPQSIHFTTAPCLKHPSSQDARPVDLFCLNLCGANSDWNQPACQKVDSHSQWLPLWQAQFCCAPVD